jgi:serine/threonine protein kinase
MQVSKLHEPFIEKEILLKLKQEYQKEPLFVKIHETESDDDHVYLVLEYCSGGTLESLVFSKWSTI